MTEIKRLKQLFNFSPILLLLFFLASCTSNQVDESFTEGLKNINNTGLYCKASGSGEPIIVIHGGPGLSHDYLYPHLQGLAKTHRLIFYDQRACGRSSIKVDTASIRIDRFVKDIDGIREAFGYEKVSLLAHSWGGLLAMKYAAQFPESIKSLLLVNPAGVSSKYAAKMNQVIAERFTTEDSLRRSTILKVPNFLDSVSLVEELMTIGFKPLFHNRELINKLDLNLNENVSTSSQLLSNLSRDLIDYNYYDDLKKIKTPTLLIYGDYDPLAEVVGQELKNSVPGSELVVFKNCGHFPFIEKPIAFDKVASQFLAKHSDKK